MFHCHTHHRMEIMQVHKKLSVLPEFCNQNSSHPLKEWKPTLFIQQTSGNRTDELLKSHDAKRIVLRIQASCPAVGDQCKEIEENNRMVQTGKRSSQKARQASLLQGTTGLSVPGHSRGTLKFPVSPGKSNVPP